jgi:transposase, IS30 family
MARTYAQLDLEDRCAIAALQQAGHSIRQIAAALDRAPSTVARELKRNSGTKIGYKPAYAQQQTSARRWTGSKLERDADLRAEVLGCLQRGWSPEQVAGRRRQQNAAATVSHETIYRFIYAQIRRTNNFDWRHFLPRAKFKRGYRGQKGGSPVQHIKDRVPISERPLYINARRQPGHWETDYMLFSRYGQSLLAAQERSSRFVLLHMPRNRKAAPTADQLHAWFASLPMQLRRSLTQDNGTEFADHHILRDALGIKTYFCNPHSPWEKGGIENANGRFRRSLPRKADLRKCSQRDIDAIALRYNNTPRKCLGFKTPAELFSRYLLHFKCESTSRLPPG